MTNSMRDWFEEQGRLAIQEREEDERFARNMLRFLLIAGPIYGLLLVALIRYLVTH